VDRRRRTRLVALVMAVLLVIPLLAGLLTFTSSSDDASTSPSPAPTLPRASDLPTVAIEELPPEAQQALLEIVQSTDVDAPVYANEDAILPEQPPGYYHRYPVEGVGRFVVGANDEIYWTDDGGRTFRELTA
jgi:guanyl-specific ribonuclease Sa